MLRKIRCGKISKRKWLTQCSHCLGKSKSAMGTRHLSRKKSLKYRRKDGKELKENQHLLYANARPFYILYFM
jgi:hypothetical protein